MWKGITLRRLRRLGGGTSRGTREETRMGTGIEVQGVQGLKPQAAAVSRICKNVVGASANYVKEQEDVSMDDEKLLELGVL